MRLFRPPERRCSREAPAALKGTNVPRMTFNRKPRRNTIKPPVHSDHRSVPSSAEAGQPFLSEGSPFLESVRQLVARGIVANSTGSLLKSQIVSLVQNYSGELRYVTGQLPDLFLDLCDMMVTGSLARMPEPAFKVYLAVMLYSDTPEEDKLKDIESIKDMTGIHDVSELKQALSHLVDDGYIESPENPRALRSRPGVARRSEEADEVALK